MPHEIHDEESGAILFRKTDGEQQIDRIEQRIEHLSTEVRKLAELLNITINNQEQILNILDNKKV